MRRSALALVLLVAAACEHGAPSTPNQPTPPGSPSAIVTGLSVTGAGCAEGVCSAQVATTLQLEATAQLSDSTTQDVTTQAQWSSSNVVSGPSGLNPSAHLSVTQNGGR